MQSIREEYVTQQAPARALFIALIGLAASIGAAPCPVHAQQLPPAQKVPRAANLVGTEWMLVESRGQHVAQNGWQPHFRLKTVDRYQDGSTGTVEGVADSCSNDLTGTYRVTADQLRFHIDGVAASLRTCRCTKEIPCQAIGALLEANPHFRIHGDELDLLESTEGVTARFIAARAN
ncbi:META domain-containing protein [Acidobacteria bacterium AB60]|nr:META domain-containing protein [Acidobacteria bacterium AB60]